MTNSNQAQATHTKAAISPVSHKTQAGSSKPDISNSEIKVIEQFPVKIKNFGNDILCHSVEALEKALAHDYKGNHVSVISTQLSGMKSIVFVSVNTEGQLFDTYSKNAISFMIKGL
jgi:hypothetical protein